MNWMGAVATKISHRNSSKHDDVIKWKHFPRYWSFVRGIHRSPVNSLHKVQWRGALMFSLIGARINGWVNNHEVSDLRRHRAHYDVTVMNSNSRNPLRQDHPFQLSNRFERLHGARQRNGSISAVVYGAINILSCSMPNFKTIGHLT